VVGRMLVEAAHGERDIARISAEVTELSLAHPTTMFGFEEPL
jgi:hypothetical protein